jgi:hypothetical protein
VTQAWHDCNFSVTWAYFCEGDTIMCNCCCDLSVTPKVTPDTKDFLNWKVNQTRTTLLKFLQFSNKTKIQLKTFQWNESWRCKTFFAIFSLQVPAAEARIKPFTLDWRGKFPTTVLPPMVWRAWLKLLFVKLERLFMSGTSILT